MTSLVLFRFSSNLHPFALFRKAVAYDYIIERVFVLQLSADTDQNVRSGSELLDRLIKDIATSTHDFQLAEFMALLRERIHTKNSNVRRFLIFWVSFL